VIPGTFGGLRTIADVKKSAKASYENHQWLKGEGLKPVPVFHLGEEWSWLERLVNDGEPYIGISPMKDLKLKEQRTWLDRVFSMLTSSDGRPFVKTHGFAATHPQLITRYPWYSVDSTTWTVTPGYGQIIVPAKRPDGTADYKRPQRIIMSGVQQQSNTAQAHQYQALEQDMRKWVDKFLAEEVGVTAFQAKYGTGIRRKAVLIYYLRLTEQVQGTRFERSSRKVGFGQVYQPTLKLKPLNNMPFHTVYATAVNREWSHIMTEAGGRTRLLSYYELRNHPEWVEPYVMQGSISPGYERRQPKQDFKSETYKNYRALEMLKQVDAWAAQVR
jgi:hypothetical protein